MTGNDIWYLDLNKLCAEGKCFLDLNKRCVPYLRTCDPNTISLRMFKTTTAAANNNNNLNGNRVKTVTDKPLESSCNQTQSSSSTVENDDSPLETALYYHYKGLT
jgi:hypothetical protein